jgi:hypothetical protein
MALEFAEKLRHIGSQVADTSDALNHPEVFRRFSEAWALTRRSGVRCLAGT